MAPLKSFSELSMKTDKRLPNLKTPVKGKKGVSKFMRMKVHSQPYSSDYKKAMKSMKSNLINPTPRAMTDDRRYF